MKLASLLHNGKETAAVRMENGRYLPIEVINRKMNMNWHTELEVMIKSSQLKSFTSWAINNTRIINRFPEWGITEEEAVYSPLMRHPEKIIGVGLNYVDHAKDLSEKAPSGEPATFMKPDTTIIGPEDVIRIPEQSNRTTAEAELAVIIGDYCRNTDETEAMNYIAGFTNIIDMTAEDILAKNPRYLTRSKSFDTFLSIGPEIITPDEIEDIFSLNVSTVINGKLHRDNVVANMTFNPLFIVAFHSRIMTLKPGDIILTGTPGAVKISEGDVVESRIDGFTVLKNKVEDLKSPSS